MSYDRGPPSWVSKQNETTMRVDSDRIHSNLQNVEKENKELIEELERIKEKLKKCEEHLKKRKAID
ncbi:MAG: hypothetical protein ACTSUO_06640 [Candidatus Thorarchaeota archaeon]